MRRLSLLIMFIMSISVLAACGNPSTTIENYVFNGETSQIVDGRSFTLEDIPESIFEDIVVQDFLYTITAEFDKKYDILADIESHAISTENEKQNFEDGIYTQSYVIHSITTLTEEQYSQEKTDSGEKNPLCYYGWEKCIDEYKLVEYKIVNVDFTKSLSPKAIEMGPQWGDGTYNRSFIVGKTSDDDSYKIYDFGMI